MVSEEWPATDQGKDCPEPAGDDSLGGEITIVGCSRAIQQVRQSIRCSANSDRSVLIIGENGTGVIDFRGGLGSTGVDIAAQVVAAANPAEGGVLALRPQRTAVHHEQPHVAVRGGGQVLLGDDEAVAADRVDHLVDVGDVLGAHQPQKDLERLLLAVVEEGRLPEGGQHDGRVAPAGYEVRTQERVLQRRDLLQRRQRR
mgnify:CR=1 FL=1